MSSTDFDQWLKDNGFLFTPFSGYLTDVKQTIRTARNLDDFKAYLTNTATAYKPVFVYKVNNGVNAYRYEESTFKQDGMAFTVIDQAAAAEYGGARAALEEEAATPGGIDMGILEQIHAWFDAHTGTRKFLKGATMWAIAYAILNQAQILATLPPEQLAIGGAVFGGLAWALQWMQANTEWPIIGARANSKKKR